MLNVAEIIIILVIVVLVVGIGRVQKIGSALHQAKLDLERGSSQNDTVIDITPRAETTPKPRRGEGKETRPGTRRDPVEDAEIEPV